MTLTSNDIYEVGMIIKSINDFFGRRSDLCRQRDILENKMFINKELINDADELSDIQYTIDCTTRVLDKITEDIKGDISHLYELLKAIIELQVEQE